jgi:hypothetical protein
MEVASMPNDDARTIGPVWQDEDEYWRNNYAARPYAGDRPYDEWRPAYRFGYESATRYPERDWDEVEGELARDWDAYEHRRDPRSTWQQVKDAARDAWARVTGR